MGPMSAGFDKVLALVEPIVFANVDEKASVACAREIAEDIAYMITHGYTVEMCKHPEKRNGV